MVSTREAFDKDKKYEKTGENNPVQTNDAKRTPEDIDSRSLKTLIFPPTDFQKSNLQTMDIQIPDFQEPNFPNQKYPLL